MAIQACSIRSSPLAAVIAIFLAGTFQTASATDYFLTIGGGYSKAGNQASLEANVVFYQQLLTDKHRGPRRHDILFADGNDPGADLQVLADKPTKSIAPATDLLAVLHRRNSEEKVTYRNHRVQPLVGALDPKLVRNQLDVLSKTMRTGDRMLVYVTAHGSEGPKDDRFNTTIDCWNNRKFTAREFTGWLDQLPTDVPVVMVMAQCYCGGFAHTIFNGLDEKKGLSPQLRVGFFAQQHNLPAAGCRPDVEHDEEFSSYFWGAMAGKTRNGVAIKGCDIDGNGSISFAEAYAHMVVAGETIDIPLRSSEVLLRTYSRLTPEEATDETRDGPEPPKLFTMTGSVESLLMHGGQMSKHMATQLAKTLDVSLQDDVSAVTRGYDESRRRAASRGRGRQSSGRRDLLKEVSEKYPELGDEKKWAESSLLKAENQESLLAELQQLPSWKLFDERRQQATTADKEGDQREIRSVKFRRLLNVLEGIVLEKNLPLVAAPEIVERYRLLVALEKTGL
ncbi:hypothetical protein [Anatilimnocola floriformis]|uniref:hypothetical protein n=1 Tax=Anatilimnocola floriformis TaxID=2948575 RepID=UPI0020C37BF3|nr:hypothetical protein [Anatilimnocola floriformis]